MSEYQDKLRDPRWQKFKALVHIRDNWTCVRCGAKDRTLVAHHGVYLGEPWTAPFHEMVTLCWDCHEALHVARNTVATEDERQAFLTELRARLKW